MAAMDRRKRFICISAALTIIGGLVFLALFPTKLKREELDMQRIVEADALEAAFEQYLLHEARRAARETEQQEPVTE